MFIFFFTIPPLLAWQHLPPNITSSRKPSRPTAISWEPTLGSPDALFLCCPEQSSNWELLWGKDHAFPGLSHAWHMGVPNESQLLSKKCELKVLENFLKMIYWVDDSAYKMALQFYIVS